MLDLAAARAAWPGVENPADVFDAYVAARVVDPDAACIPDLWLACAIGRGDPAALRAFDSLLGGEVAPAIAHLDGGSALVGDVTHAVRERVLGGAGAAKIGEYRGRGDLRGWLRVVAVREALQLLRQRKREAPLPDDIELAVAVDAGASLAMTDKERAVYRDAFTAALSSLTPRDRNLLRQHYLYSATIDELGALYAVHRATAARWIADVRATLLDRTRRHVADALRLSGDELDSVMGRVAAHLDYSLRYTLSFER